jgi:hypothetical protein
VTARKSLDTAQVAVAGLPTKWVNRNVAPQMDTIVPALPILPAELTRQGFIMTLSLNA